MSGRLLVVVWFLLVGTLSLAADPLDAALRKEAEKRMPTHEWVFSNVVAHKVTYFGLTSYNTRDDAKADMGTLSVWERLGGKWSFVFDYRLPTQFVPSGGSREVQIAREQSRRDALYASHGFSSSMRKKLEKKLKDQTSPRGPGEPHWRYFW